MGNIFWTVCREVNMNEVLIKIVQSSVVTETMLGGLAIIVQLQIS